MTKDLLRGICVMLACALVGAMMAAPTHAQFRDYGDAAADQYDPGTTTTTTTPVPPPAVVPTNTVTTPTVTGSSTTPTPGVDPVTTVPGSEDPIEDGTEGDTKAEEDGGGQSPAEGNGGQGGSPGSKGLKELPFTGWAILGLVLLSLLLLLLGETARRVDRARSWRT